MKLIHHMLISVALSITLGLAHAQRVVPTGSGFIGDGVFDAVIFDGKLVMGGRFVRFNDVPVRGLCSWDGTQAEFIESGLIYAAGRVFQLEVLGDRLVACFSNSSHGMVAAWDGEQWSDLQVVPFSPVEAIHAHGDILYAGNNAGQVFKLESGTWEFLGNVAPNKIQTLIVHDDVLFAGSADGPSVNDGHLHAYDGTSWITVGGGLNGGVTAFHSDANGLHIAGTFTASNSGQSLSRLARWNGQSFDQVPNSIDNTVVHIDRTAEGELVASTLQFIFHGPGLAQRLPVSGSAGVHDLNGVRYVVGRVTAGDGYFPCNGIAELLPGMNTAQLDLNNISANVVPMQNSFEHWWNGDYVRFEVPKGGGVNAIYSSSPWLLAMHGTDRHVSVPGYSTMLPPEGNFRDHPGPQAIIMDEAFLERYYRIWKLDRSQVQAHILGWSAPGYEMPEAIASWPGNGDVGNGEPSKLAPFADVNGNGLYEPDQGEYPLIKGDQAIYTITHTNDRIEFYQDSLMPLPFDLHIMHYSFHGDGDMALEHTVFVNYKFVNRSDLTFTDIRFGQFADIDIGNPDDDFSGCDSTRNMFFVYNWDDDDETTNTGNGYGPQPPAIGVRFLSQPMQSHRSIRFHGLEVASLDDAMYGLWFGAPFTELGYPTHFQFPGGSFSEQVPTLATPDRTVIGASGPFTMGPGDTLCMDLAFIYARAGSGGAYASVEGLKLRADSVQAAYDAYGIGCGSYPSMVSVPDVQAHEQVRLFPNPAHDRVTVMADTPVKGLELLDAQGRLVLTASATGTRTTLDLRGLMPGFYAVRIHTTVQTHVHRLVVH